MDFDEAQKRLDEARAAEPCMGVPFEANRILAEKLDSEDNLPEWIQLTPSRGKFEGRDGRRFRIASPNRMVRDFNSSGEHLQLDIDHESEFAGFTGGTTKASGWLTEMAVRNGGQIFGRIEWTPAGADLVRNREFRGISPTFLVTRESQAAFLENPEKAAMEVTGFQSVALTNRPNLPLRSLNTQQEPQKQSKETMDPKVLAALGLGDDATPADILTAVNALRKPAPTPAPNLDHLVPRADLDAVRAEANAAQAQLEEVRTAQHNAAVDTAVQNAVSAGKIAPASEAYHRECCSTPEGLKKFQEYVASAAPIIKPNTEEAPKDSDSIAPNSGLTPAQEHLAKQWMLSAEEFNAERALLVSEGKLRS